MYGIEFVLSYNALKSYDPLLLLPVARIVILWPITHSFQFCETDYILTEPIKIIFSELSIQF